jgi:hypothetical protein
MRAARLLLPLLAASGCGLATRVRPVPPGALALEGAVGGPAAVVGAPVPLPLATLGVAYGVLPRLDVSAHTHLTTLFNNRTAGFDLGVTGLWLEAAGARPALVSTFRGLVFTDFAGGALWYLDATVVASWQLHPRWLLFVQAMAEADLTAGAVDPMFGVGVEWHLERTTLQAELRWYAPNQDTSVSAVPWLSPFHQGAVGLGLGVRYDLFPFGPAPAGD